MDFRLGPSRSRVHQGFPSSCSNRGLFLSRTELTFWCGLTLRYWSTLAGRITQACGNLPQPLAQVVTIRTSLVESVLVCPSVKNDRRVGSTLLFFQPQPFLPTKCSDSGQRQGLTYKLSREHEALGGRTPAKQGRISRRPMRDGRTRCLAGEGGTSIIGDGGRGGAVW